MRGADDPAAAAAAPRPTGAFFGAMREDDDDELDGDDEARRSTASDPYLARQMSCVQALTPRVSHTPLFVPYGRVGVTTNFLLSSSLSLQKHARFTQVQAA